MASSPSSSSSNSWILSVKSLLITTGVISIAYLVTKLFIPLMLNFAITDLPAIWSIIISWLKPPYLYIIINGIIITIAASTHFQHNNHDKNQNQNQNQNQYQNLNLNQVNVNQPNPVHPLHDLGPVMTEPCFNIEPIVEPPVVYETKLVVVDPVVTRLEVDGVDENEYVTTWEHPSQAAISSHQLSNRKVELELNIPARDKRLLSSRFAQTRKQTKASPEGARALRVLKPKKHETMETTWKMITDGRQMPLNRHLKKSDTFKNDNESNEFISTTTKSKVVKKSETFKDRTNYENENQYLQPNSSPASGGNQLKKEGSLSHDELNKRVEAFIKKFNDDMKLQRQESLNQYMEMVNRGAH